MISTMQFVEKYNGKFIDYDGALGCQCVDEMRQYCEEVLGINGRYLASSGTAKSIFANFADNGDGKFKKIYNKIDNFPVRGDIVFWGFYLGITGIAGHVSICTDATTKNFISFDQNWPKNHACQFINHSYKGVAGWLHPIKN